MLFWGIINFKLDGYSSYYYYVLLLHTCISFPLQSNKQHSNMFLALFLFFEFSTGPNSQNLTQSQGISSFYCAR